MSSIDDLLQQTTQTDDDLNISEQTDEKSAPEDQPLKPEEVVLDIQQNIGPEFSAEQALTAKIKAIKQKKHEDELKQKAQDLSLGYINLHGIPIPADVLRLLPKELVEQNKMVCFYYAPHKLVRIALSEESLGEIDNIKSQVPEKFPKVNLEWFLASSDSFATAKKQYDNLPQIKEPRRGVEILPEDFEKMSASIRSLSDIKQKIKDVSTTELVTLIIATGVKVSASDIHIECEVDGIKLRYRVDGVLHTACILEKEMWQQIISRLKLLSELKLNITQKPQDGRFSIFLPSDKIDVRVSTLPTAYGESVVMRLLMSKAVGLKFKDLGLSESALGLLTQEMGRPNGMIITTGPTGSGKTTTLYAILNELNDQETKIITIEDPIEYELEGINQSQVDPDRDYTFVRGLRSIVRQDPDIIMVGEMRDIETVDIGLNAALTGHLVLSTLHTNDAAGALPRFLAMGAKPYLLAPALNLIMAQRLVRRLCNRCKKEVELDKAKREKVLEILGSLGKGEFGKGEVAAARAKFYAPGRCDECNQFGYKGRIGIFEMFQMTPEIEQIILSGEVSEYKIREIAKKNGMITMAQDGLLKAVEGITSVDEVFRVVE